jgi:hypothetical protein
MFHLPTPDHRTELMIIYGEALPADTPLRKEGRLNERIADLCGKAPQRFEKPTDDPGKLSR